MYIYRKPRNAEHVLEILRETNNKAYWATISEQQKWFGSLEPMVLIFRIKKLIGFAHHVDGKVCVVAPKNQSITELFTKQDIGDIDVAIKQIELF